MGTVRRKLTLIVFIALLMLFLISKRSDKPQQPVIYSRTEQDSNHYNEVSNEFEVNADRITVVTAYFDLGTFFKGSKENKFTKQIYFGWAGIFRFMTNPLVVYTDALDFYELMKTLRRDQETNTKIFLIRRNSSWAFQNELKIKRIISNESYPKHYPNTVVSGYPCSQHAKYDVIERVAKADFFKTKFISWVDIGYFRDRKSDRHFELVKLQDFNESCVLMNQVYNVSMNKDPKSIFLNNLVWVGGGLVMGERGRIIQFAKDFRLAVEFYLSKDLVNTDQQVIYAMYSKCGRHDIKPSVEIQLYKSIWNWFGLGYRMLKEETFERPITSKP